MQLFKRQRLLWLLSIMTIFLLSIWWRWIYLPPHDLNLVTIQSVKPDQVNDLDVVLKRHIRTLQANPALLAQVVRESKEITLTSLFIDQCEVSQGQFRRFASWRALRVPEPARHPRRPEKWEYKSLSAKHKVLGQLAVSAGGLSFFDAWAYCRAAGGRLPTSDEYEALSTGKEKRLYPWGNVFNRTAWRYQDPSLNITVQCGDSPENATPSGIYDLGSSLLEWTVDTDQLGHERPTLMGGNAFNKPSDLHALTFIRRPAPYDFRSQYTGFRCVYPASHQKQLQTVKKMPWGTASTAVKVIGTRYSIGADADSKIANLLRHLESASIQQDLQNFPISPPNLNVQVMRYEVTRAQYNRFLQDPLVYVGLFNHPKHPQHITHTPNDWDNQKQALDKPVTQITWWSAWAYAKWLGGQLPTAQLWQALAGRKVTVFPYGNSYEPLRSVDRLYKSLHSVQASKDITPDGIAGFGGNVAEWTNTSILRGNAFTIVIKGGSYLMPSEGTQVAQSGEAVPDYANEDVGFRVVFPAKNR